MTISAQDMLARLVGFDTTSHLSNLDLISFVESYLADFDITSRRFANEDGTKANLLATIGPAEVQGGIVLSGHTDVVPVKGQDWATDPFSLTERDGKLFGRGTCDMKGFIAAALSKVPALKDAQSPVPVHLAFSYDEEVGCTGVRSLVDFLAAELPLPRLVIVGEPSNMQVINAHKGINAFTTIVRGHEAHSSRTHAGINAVSYAARVIAAIEELAADMRAKGDASGRFDPPYTTVHVGKLHGGTALNIIPREAVIDWEIRNLPGQQVSDLKQRFDAAVAEIVADMDAAVDAMPEEEQEAARGFVGIETITGAAVPGLAPSDDQDAEAIMLTLAQANSIGAVSYGTEAGHFQAIDIPTLICGPGSIDQAHKPNEFVTVDQLRASELFLDRLVDWLAGQR